MQLVISTYIKYQLWRQNLRQKSKMFIIRFVYNYNLWGYLIHYVKILIFCSSSLLIRVKLMNMCDYFFSDDDSDDDIEVNNLNNVNMLTETMELGESQNLLKTSFIMYKYNYIVIEEWIIQ